MCVCIERRRGDGKGRTERLWRGRVHEEGNLASSSIPRLSHPCWGLEMGVQQNCFSEWNSEEKQNKPNEKKKPTKQGLEISIHHCSELLLSTRQEGAAAPLPCTPPGPGTVVQLLLELYCCRSCLANFSAAAFPGTENRGSGALWGPVSALHAQPPPKGSSGLQDSAGAAIHTSLP